MIKRLLEDRMIYLALRRGWLRLEESGDADLRSLIEIDPGEALTRLVGDGRLKPDQIEKLEQDARSEIKTWSDITHDELPVADFIPTLPVSQEPVPGTSQSGEHRLWARLAGISQGEPWGPYRLQGLLGEGGMGRVYKALDPMLGRPVALKILQRSGGQNLERFFNEARAQARVEHPNVAKVFAVGEAEGLPFISMQYVNGTTLKVASSHLRLEEKVSVMVQICEGVHAAHRLGIIHRDLKPGNVMIEKTSDGIWYPVVLDFGLAWMAENVALTQVGQTVGTPQYMSPEQARGLALDRRSDVYALGVTFFEFLCGRPPFEGDQPLDILRKATETEPPSLRSIVPDLPKDLETIVLKAMEKSPAHRYDSARAMGEDFKAYLDGEPIAARPSSKPDRWMKWVRRNRVISAVVAASSLLLLVVIAFSATAVLRSKAQARSAQRFSSESQRLETLLAKVYALPTHSVQASEDEVRRELARLEQEVSGLGFEAEGPGRLALGRTHLTLGDLDEAHTELNRAWGIGYRTPDVAEALGRAKAGLYRAALAGVSGSDLLERRKELDTKLRLPALDLLRQAKGATTGAPDLTAAELALTEGRYQEALDFSRKARDSQPWLYQAFLLDAEVRFAQAVEPSASRDFASTRRLLDAAGDDISKAREVGRSAPAVFEMEALRRADVIRLRVATATAHAEDLVWAEAAAREALDIRPHSWKAYGSIAAMCLFWANQTEDWNQDPRAVIAQGIHAADQALARRPGSNDLLSTLAYLWWRQAEVEQVQGQDPRPALRQAEAALQRALIHPELAATLHQRMGNCFTTQAIYELRTGGDPESAVATAEQHLRESLRLKPSGMAMSDIIWALSVRAQALVRKGQDPVTVVKKAEDLFGESLRLTPDYYFARTNLADILLLRAEFLEGRNQDPSLELNRAGGLARDALKEKAGLPYAVRDLAQTALLRARWKIRVGQNPVSDLAEAQAYFQEGHQLRLGQTWPDLGLLACRLEALKMKGRLDALAFQRLGRDANQLAKAHPNDPDIKLFLARIASKPFRQNNLATEMSDPH